MSGGLLQIGHQRREPVPRGDVGARGSILSDNGEVVGTALPDGEIRVVAYVRSLPSRKASVGGERRSYRAGPSLCFLHRL
jgi:hypothetical protein